MTKDEFIKEITKLNIAYTNDMLDKLEVYKEYLKEYNEHTNLTRITNDDDIYLKHFYDSLTIIKAIDLNNINNLLDKKTKFLENLAKKLNLNVTVVNKRVEDYAKDNLNKFDLVTGRAVASLRILSELSLPLVKKDGYFLPLKANIDNEYDDALDTISILNGIVEKIITFNLYENEGLRNIIIIRKLENSGLDNLRTYDKILKKPLVKKN